MVLVPRGSRQRAVWKVFNLTSLEKAINDQAAKGYRLHTITTASSGSKGMIGGGDRIQATMVFERLG